MNNESLILDQLNTYILELDFAKSNYDKRFQEIKDLEELKKIDKDKDSDIQLSMNDYEYFSNKITNLLNDNDLSLVLEKKISQDNPEKEEKSIKEDIKDSVVDVLEESFGNKYSKLSIDDNIDSLDSMMDITDSLDIGMLGGVDSISIGFSMLSSVLGSLEGGGKSPSIIPTKKKKVNKDLEEENYLMKLSQFFPQDLSYN